MPYISLTCIFHFAEEYSEAPLELKVCLEILLYCYITMATQNTAQGLRKHKMIDKEKEQQK